MRTSDILNEYYDEKNDNYNIVNIDHVRRPKITLLHLQKLRKTRALEELEQKQRIKDVASIYGHAPSME